MKKNIKTLICCLIFGSGYAQFNEWTWMTGSNVPGAAAVYGTKGVPGVLNTPGTCYEGVEWTDNTGIFWLLDSNFGDFWKYDPATNMWTWINSGPVTWGVQGIPSLTNFPGRHGFGAQTWTDKNNDLWLYGGTTGGWDANLWRYNIGSGMWTWMSGPGKCSCPPSVYGTMGVAAATNTPGARAENSCTWVDGTGVLWLFGGQGCTGTCVGAATTLGFSDLWTYDTGTNNWTWMSGPSLDAQPPVYGTKGLASALNTPGGRMVFAGSKLINNDFFLFGGFNIWAGTGLNDTWKYNIVTDEWTWLHGPNLPNQPAVYGAKCVSSPTNVPAAGYEVRTRWTDDCGNLWIFGTGQTTYANDLWRYSIKNNTWTWVSGTNLNNQPGVFGIKGISSPANIPPSLKGGNAWRTKTDFYLYGGTTFTGLLFNNLWRYRPDKPIALFANSTPGGCSTTINFSNNSTPGCNEIKSFEWNFGDPGSGINNISIAENPSHTFSTSGTYSVKLVVTNCTGSKDSIAKTIVINAGGITAAISNQSNPVCSGGTGTAIVVVTGGSSPFTYSWSNGQSTQTGTGLAAGNYTITVSDNSGCTTSVALSIISPLPLSMQFARGTANCAECGCKEWIMVTGAGGANPYTYLWPDGYSNRYKNKLCPGAYSVTIKDKNNCSINVSLSVP
ncbi:MAG: PKD domain-containing protein [Bacteroidia bacterium]|nr:PKD domain-containing protein [Bacteroidia bacterium]